MKLFKRKKLLDTSKPAVSLDVIIINDSGEGLYECLGISDDRSDELLNLMVKCQRESNDKPETLSALSKYCKHPNELVFVTYCMAAHWEKNPFVINLGQ